MNGTDLPDCPAAAGSMTAQESYAEPQSHAEIIALWPSAEALAEALGEQGVKVRQWKRRGIPSDYWPDLVDLAKARGLTQVTEAVLARLSPRRRRPRPPARAVA